MYNLMPQIVSICENKLQEGQEDFHFLASKAETT